MLPPPPPRPPLPPPPPSSVNPPPQLLIPKQDQESLLPPFRRPKKPPDQPILRQPRRTNPLIWCVATICLIFSLLLIFFGIATLIVFLAVRPRTPLFDTAGATLNVIYFDSPEYFNGDFTLLANFSNPNRKIDVRFEYLNVELFFSNTLVAKTALQPFSLRRRQTKIESIHLISSLVHLPENHGFELQRQVQTNRINYNVRGSFRVRIKLGLIHFSYWLNGRCQLEMTSPPTGVLIARRCRTNR